MTEQDSASSMMLDRNLAVVLSRLAGLLGQAVPAHRFGMMSRTTEGLMVDHLSREERLKAWWLGRFPTAHIHAMDPKNLKPSDFPLLWVGSEGEQVLLVRGGSGRHRLTCQDPEGNPCVLPMADARQGRLLKLSIMPARPGESGHRALSATDWFATSIRR